jgi:hypothetical protein
MPEEETVVTAIPNGMAKVKAQALEEKALKSKFLNFQPLQIIKRLSEVPLYLAIVKLTMK